MDPKNILNILGGLGTDPAIACIGAIGLIATTVNPLTGPLIGICVLLGAVAGVSIIRKGGVHTKLFVDKDGDGRDDVTGKTKDE